MQHAFNVLFIVGTAMGLVGMAGIGNDAFMAVATTLGLVGMAGIIATYRG